MGRRGAGHVLGGEACDESGRSRGAGSGTKGVHAVRIESKAGSKVLGLLRRQAGGSNGWQRHCIGGATVRGRVEWY